jgi:ribosomal protein S18 acetylase RimI-like enzyme
MQPTRGYGSPLRTEADLPSVPTARTTLPAVQEIELSIVDASSVDAQWALSQYFAELDRRFPDGFDPGDAIHEDAPLFNDPAGCFIVARRDGETVGCGALTVLDDETAEIKRMWISPTCRGVGLGRRLLARLEDESRRFGRPNVVLDTNGVLLEAIAMYRSCGYVEVGRYNDNPYAQLWFAKTLARAASDAAPRDS